MRGPGTFAPRIPTGSHNVNPGRMEFAGGGGWMVLKVRNAVSEVVRGPESREFYRSLSWCQKPAYRDPVVVIKMMPTPATTGVTFSITPRSNLRLHRRFEGEIQNQRFSSPASTVEKLQPRPNSESVAGEGSRAEVEKR